MREKTTSFIEEAMEEATDFAKKIKTHGIEMSDQLKNHFDLLDGDEKRQEEELDAKKVEHGEVLLDFLFFEGREEVILKLDAVEEHVIGNIGSRETKISRSL